MDTVSESVNRGDKPNTPNQRVRVITLFPELFKPFNNTSLIGKAIKGGALEITPIQLRDFAEPPHYRVDDTPYGGGPGMVMKPEPLALAIEECKAALPHAKVLLASPSGPRLTQETAVRLSGHSQLILVAGRYEAIDQRAIDALIDEQFSLGDYVLMGGEIPCMALIESVSRLIPGVIGNLESTKEESFSSSGQLLEAPHYTRPPEWRGVKVPEVLLKGDHTKIKAWRKEQSLNLTKKIRPDLC